MLFNNNNCVLYLPFAASSRLRSYILLSSSQPCPIPTACASSSHVRGCAPADPWSSQSKRDRSISSTCAVRRCKAWHWHACTRQELQLSTLRPRNEALYRGHAAVWVGADCACARRQEREGEREREIHVHMLTCMHVCTCTGIQQLHYKSTLQRGVRSWCRETYEPIKHASHMRCCRRVKHIGRP